MSTSSDSAAVTGAATEVQFSSVLLKTGVRLRYAYKGDPSGTPVIMLHGFTDSWFSFSRVLPLLDKKYRVYSLDQRGHGDSDRPAVGYGMQQFAADVIAFMDAMNLKQATIVGHCMGSFVAQHVAYQVPDRVTKLVLVASGTNLRNETVRGLRREIDALKDTAAVPEAFARDFQASTIYSPLPEEFVQAVVKESLKVPVHVWREVLGELLAPEADVQLNKIQTPTLIVWGEKESLFPRSEQDLLTSALRNSAFKAYPETGHALHWERPDRFAKDLQEFIN